MHSSHGGGGEAPPLKLAQAPHTSPTQVSAGLCGLTGRGCRSPCVLSQTGGKWRTAISGGRAGSALSQGQGTSPPGASAAPHLPASLHICRSLSASPGLLPSHRHPRPVVQRAEQGRHPTTRLPEPPESKSKARDCRGGGGGWREGGPAQPPGVSSSPCHTSVLQDPTTSPGTVRTSHCRVKGCLDPHSQGVGTGWHPGLHAVPLGGRNFPERPPLFMTGWHAPSSEPTALGERKWTGQHVRASRSRYLGQRHCQVLAKGREGKLGLSIKGRPQPARLPRRRSRWSVPAAVPTVPLHCPS